MLKFSKYEPSVVSISELYEVPWLSLRNVQLPPAAIVAFSRPVSKPWSEIALRGFVPVPEVPRLVTLNVTELLSPGDSTKFAGAQFISEGVLPVLLWQLMHVPPYD